MSVAVSRADRERGLRSITTAVIGGNAEQISRNTHHPTSYAT